MVKGTAPSSRDSHSCTTVGASLYVFGGTDGKTPLQDLYILDTITNTWSKPQVEGDGPAPREGHSAALIGHILFIFGGCGKTADESEEIYFNDLYMLDTVKLHWTKAITKGTPPAPRDSHTCSAWSNKLIVLGGEDASDSYLADVHILDTDVMEWKELHASGQMLMPRAGHATVTVGKHVFVFGGFTDDRKLYDDLHMLNLETGLWTKVVTTGLGPSARFSVAGDCVDARSGILVFIGGCNENLEALDDMYYLDTELQAEKGQDERAEKFSLRKELKRKRQENQLLVVKSPELEKEAISEPKSKPRANVNTSAADNTPGVGLYELKPVEEKIFEAKITDVFHYGYTIESNIDGKLLRGLLFSYKPGFAHAVHAYLTRKKLSSDGNSSQIREARKTKLKIARATKHAVSTPEGQSTASEHANIGESVPSSQLVTLPNQHAQYMQSPHSQPQQPQIQHRQPQQHQYPQQHQQFLQWQQQQQHLHYPHQQQLHSPSPNHHQQQRAPLNAPSPSVLQQDPRHYVGSGYVGLPLPSDVTSHHQSSGQAGMFATHSLPSPAQGIQPSREQALQTDQQ